MKNMLLTAAFCALLFSLSAWNAAFAGALAVASPPDNSFVESGLINIVVKGEQMAVDEVQISVNGKRPAGAAKPLNRPNSCFSGIRLSPGMNEIRVIGLKGGMKAEEMVVRVFCRSNRSPGPGTAPAGFRKYLFHTDEREKGCAPCHQLDFGKTGGVKQGPAGSPCHACHKKMLNDYRFVHGPAAVWSCLACHDGKSGKAKLGVAKPDVKSCKECHERSWDSMKFRHGQAAGNCTACHDPHASDKPFLLKM